MPRQVLVSEIEALNFLLPGGSWMVANALNISGGAEAFIILPEGYRGVKLYPSADAYVKFDVTNGSTISTANALILKSGQIHSIPIPYDIGEQAAGKAPVLHVRQVASAAAQSVRVVLT